MTRNDGRQVKPLHRIEGGPQEYRPNLKIEPKRAPDAHNGELELRMNESTITENVITGIIAGVSAGIIMAILVEAKRNFDFRMKRRSQIKYIRQIVEEHLELILSAQAVPPSRTDAMGDDLSEGFPLDGVRGAYFGSWYRQITEALEGRADTLTFDEKKEVRYAFGAFGLVLPGSDPFNPPLPNSAGYHQIFDRFEAIRWLRIKRFDRAALGRRPPGEGA